MKRIKMKPTFKTIFDWHLLYGEQKCNDCHEEIMYSHDGICIKCIRNYYSADLLEMMKNTIYLIENKPEVILAELI